MHTKWEEAFIELVKYIEDNPSIKIEEVISIPSETKANFYNKFDKVRFSILECVLAPNSLEKATFLGREYTELEKKIVDNLGLKQIILEPKLRKFLNDPGDELMAELYFPLFDLLRGKSNRESFMKHCSYLPSKFHEFYQSVYCKWISLALLKLFNAKRIGTFYMPFSARKQRRGLLVNDRPRLISADFIEFDSKKPFVSPDFAAYSSEIGCYFAVKTEMQKGFAKFAYGPDSTTERRWTLPAPGMKIFTSDNIFVYVSEDMQDISLLVNKAVCCPDALIRCFSQGDWYTQERWQETLELNEKLLPKITCVVGQTPANENFQADGRIKIIDMEFEYHKLEDIVSELIAPFKTACKAKTKRRPGSLLNKWLKLLVSPFAPKTHTKRYL
jgi:hypothetical protein